MAVNALAPFWTVKAFLPSMKERKSGHIVNIGSVLGIFGGAQLTDYSASKFAVFGFTECLRLELKSEGSPICTTLICPFHIDTGMFAGVTVPWYSRILFPVLKQGWVARKVVEAILMRDEVVLLRYQFWLVFLLRVLVPPWLVDRLGRVLGSYYGMKSFVGHAKKRT
jgi:all-trans-retinol dehydrogenase (NAD+)